MSCCGIIILAAGGSTRLGEPKQLLRYQGETLLERAAKLALKVTDGPVLVVLGSSFPECSRVLADLPVQIVKNPGWREGLASSIRAGVAALPEVDGVLILLCDQLQVTAEHLIQLVAANAGIAVSSYDDCLGPPIYFASCFFGDLLELQGEVGAKPVLEKHAGQMVVYPFPEAIHDLDTPQDRKKWID